MTLPATLRRAGPFEGNGSTTVFPFTFKVFAGSDLVVIHETGGVESPLVLDSDYSVALNADQDASPGGNITYPLSGAPLPVGSTLVAVGGLPYDQTLDLPGGGNYSPLALENALDRIEMQIQQLAENMVRALVLPVTFDGGGLFPNPIAYYLLGWDENGNIVNYAPGAGSSSVNNEYLATQWVKPVALVSAATVTVDALASNNFTLTAAHTFTLANPTDLRDGMILNFRFKQDATGNRVASWGSKYKFAGGTAGVLSTAANAVDFMSCYYDQASDTLACVLNTGFA